MKMRLLLPCISLALLSSNCKPRHRDTSQARGLASGVETTDGGELTGTRFFTGSNGMILLGICRPGQPGAVPKQDLSPDDRDRCGANEPMRRFALPRAEFVSRLTKEVTVSIELRQALSFKNRNGRDFLSEYYRAYQLPQNPNRPLIVTPAAAAEFLASEIEKDVIEVEAADPGQGKGFITFESEIQFSLYNAFAGVPSDGMKKTKRLCFEREVAGEMPVFSESGKGPYDTLPRYGFKSFLFRPAPGSAPDRPTAAGTCRDLNARLLEPRELTNQMVPGPLPKRNCIGNPKLLAFLLNGKEATTVWFNGIVALRVTSQGECEVFDNVDTGASLPSPAEVVCQSPIFWDRSLAHSCQM